MADHTERPSARIVLRETEQAAFLSSILESSTEYSIVAKDLRGTITAWNEGHAGRAEADAGPGLDGPSRASSVRGMRKEMLRDRSADGDESAVKRVQPEPELLQGHGSKEGEAVRRSHEARCRRFFSSEGHDDVSEVPDLLSAVRQDNRALGRGEASNRVENRTRDHCIRGPGIHQEAKFLTLFGGVSRPDARADRKLSHVGLQCTTPERLCSQADRYAYLAGVVASYLSGAQPRAG